MKGVFVSRKRTGHEFCFMKVRRCPLHRSYCILWNVLDTHDVCKYYGDYKLPFLRKKIGFGIYEINCKCSTSISYIGRL